MTKYNCDGHFCDLLELLFWGKVSMGVRFDDEFLVLEDLGSYLKEASGNGLKIKIWNPHNTTTGSLNSPYLIPHSFQQNMKKPIPFKFSIIEFEKASQ
jgi:hypothetical protein